MVARPRLHGPGRENPAQGATPGHPEGTRTRDTQDRSKGSPFVGADAAPTPKRARQVTWIVEKRHVPTPACTTISKPWRETTRVLAGQLLRDRALKGRCRCLSTKYWHLLLGICLHLCSVASNMPVWHFPAMSHRRSGSARCSMCAITVGTC